MIRNQKESGLVERARFARRFDDAPDVSVHSRGGLQRFGRARPVGVMRAIEINQVNQHQVRLIGFKDIFSVDRAPPVGRLILTRTGGGRLLDQARRRVLQGALAGLYLLCGVGDFGHDVINLCARRHRPADVAGRQPRARGY